MSADDEASDVQLTNAQIERIADLAADRAVDKLTAAVQLEIGKSVLRALRYVAGAAVVAAVAWLTVHGYLKP